MRKPKTVCKIKIVFFRNNPTVPYTISVERYTITRNTQRFVYGVNENNPQDTVRAVKVHLDKLSNKIVIGEKIEIKIYTIQEEKIEIHKQTLIQEIMKLL